MLINRVKKEGVKGRLRRYLLMVGVGAVGILVSVVLHNLVYGLMIVVFGSGIWEKWGTNDESVFFILGLVVFPLMLVVGIIGSGVEWWRQGRS